MKTENKGVRTEVRLTGPPLPGTVRAVSAATNMAAFGQAFPRRPGTPMSRDAGHRITIW
jgi:predicted metalloendopeptidase